jgi:hypothetical protein
MERPQEEEQTRVTQKLVSKESGDRTFMRDRRFLCLLKRTN